MKIPLLSALAALVAALAALPACGRDEPSAPPPAPQVAAPAPAPAPAPPVASAASGLQPAAQPVLSTPVPEGFARESSTQQPDAPWVHVRGRAKLDEVIEFYTRYLDPGTPAAAPPEQQPRCTSWTVRPRRGCTGSGCAERVCLSRAGGQTRFLLQHPKPPGTPAAEVNVIVTTIRDEVRVTIENESLMRILRENAATEQQEPQELPEKQLTQYRNLEDIPPELID